MKKLWDRLLHKIFLRESMERATFHFIGQTVFRRQEQMLYWGSFIAAGIALINWSYYNIGSSYPIEGHRYPVALLSIPLILSFFLLVGLRFAFSIPADLDANWLFRIIDKEELRKACGGAHKFMLAAIMLPLLLLIAPIYLVALNPASGLLHVLYVVALSLLLVETLLFQFEKLPFTCSYLPGKANIKLWWPAYVLACYGYSYGATVLEQWILRDPKRYVLFILIAGFAWAQLNQRRSQFVNKLRDIRFEEQHPDAIILLTLEQ